MSVALYDDIADWYADWVSDGAADYSARVSLMLNQLLDHPADGRNTLVDIATGTGARAATLRELGWQPIGLDLSAGQLRHAQRVLPVAVADGSKLPIRNAAVAAVTCILCHTDVPDYPGIVREATRIVQPKGMFVHIGIHPSFTGAFADRSDPARVIVDASYSRRERRFDSFTPNGVRAKIGAWHTPLPDLLHAAIDAGLTIVKVAESGPEDAVPDIFGFCATKA